MKGIAMQANSLDITSETPSSWLSALVLDQHCFAPAWQWAVHLLSHSYSVEKRVCIIRKRLQAKKHKASLFL